MRIKYKVIFGDLEVTVINRKGDTITYIRDGYVHHANIDWFMDRFKTKSECNS